MAVAILVGFFGVLRVWICGKCRLILTGCFGFDHRLANVGGEMVQVLKPGQLHCEICAITAAK
jgi:hypothetical protein